MMLIVFELLGLIAFSYTIGVIGVWHTNLTRRKVVGITYGLLMIILPALLLVPSHQANAPWWWLLIVGGPLPLGWMSVWKVFRVNYLYMNVIIGIAIGVIMLGLLLFLFSYPAFLQNILRVVPLPRYPIA